MSDDDLKPSDTPALESTATQLPSCRYVRGKDGVGRDRVLDRAVAMLDSGAAGSDELLRTARFLGRLEHPGLPCVYDITHDDHGACLIARPLHGCSLSAAIVQRANGHPLEALADATACAITFINICNALAAAHRQGVVHGRLTPDSLIIGPDGTIEITGWDQAMKLMERPLTMRFTTKVSASTSRPLEGLCDDIQGLGACLYTAVVGEAPPRDRFGHLTQVPLDAVAAIPAELEIIIRQAMASTAASGYHSVADLRADLMRFIAGQTPQAIKPSRLARIMDWANSHQRALWVMAALVAAIIGSAVLFNWSAVKTYAAWGSPLVIEEFNGESWKPKWATIGNWEQKDGRLVTSSEYACALVFRQRLSPPVAIEYTGSFSSAVRPGDLSVWWCEGDALSSVPVASLPGRFIQAGAHENSWCTILQTPEKIRTEVANFVLKPEVTYHFRVEVEADRLRMWINGELLLDHKELFPIGSGTIALYSYDPGKSFDNIRIWQRAVPELISPLALGDVAYRAGRFSEADMLYGRVAESHAGKPLGVQALYFQGLSQRRMGDRAKAWKTWQSMPDGTLRRRSDSLVIEDLVEQGEVKTASERFSSMWTERPDVRDDLRQSWQMAGQHLTTVYPLPHADMDAWISLRDACFGDDQSSRWLVAIMLDRMQRWDEILVRFPDERRAVGPALIALGRGAEVIASDWTTSLERITAMVGVGDLEGAVRSPDINRDLRLTLLCKLGRAEEAALIDPYPAMMYLGRIDERLQSNGFGARTNDALIIAGRLEEAAGDGVPGSPDSGRDSRALLLLGRINEVDRSPHKDLFRLLEHLSAGRSEQARALRPSVIGNRDASVDALWFAHGVGLALVDMHLGDGDALRVALERGSSVTDAWGGRMALVCRAALDPAKDADVLAMPWKTEAQAWLYVAQALRGELAGDYNAAHAGWQAFAALPRNQRMLNANCLNIEVEAFAAWRLTIGGNRH